MTLTEYSVVFGLAIYIFCSALVLCLILSFLWKSREDYFQKLIGGLTVFIVALLSRNSWVIFSSLFIGGLIIASEEFMESLAAILKSTSDKIPETVAALRVEKASLKDLKNKTIEELNQLESVPLKGKELTERTKKIAKVESDVNDYLKSMLGERYEVGVKFVVKWDVVVDGGIREKDGTRIIRAVEIKYVASKNGLDSIRYMLDRHARKIIDSGIKVPILFVVASELMTLEHAYRIREECGSLGDLAFMKIKDNTVIPVMLPSILKGR